MPGSRVRRAALLSTVVLFALVALAAWFLGARPGGARPGRAEPAAAAAAPGVTPTGAPKPAFAVAAGLAQAAAERLVNEPPEVADADPALVLDATRGAVARFAPAEWEVGALAASVGHDPASAFAFVRDAIAFDPYPGVLRGADGTLAARAGNAWDRSLLLRAILDRAGFKTRLAFATFDAQTTARLVERALVPPGRRLASGTPAGLLERIAPAVARRARRDDAALRLALGSRVEAMGVDESDAARQDLTRHAWVQLLQDGGWIDLDPSLPGAKVGEALAPAARTADDVPPDQRHTVVVRVVTETLSGSRLGRMAALERVLPAAAAAQQYVLLAFLPEEGGGGGLLSGGTAPGSFVPALWVGDQVQRGRPVALKTTGGGVGFDSLFGGGESPAGELTSLSIEIETRVPGRRPSVARHVLFDRVPPAARASATVEADSLEPLSPGDGMPRAFTGFHHVMISTGGASPLAMARLRQAALETTLGLAQPGTPSNGARTPAWPLWAGDLTLVEGSERLVVDAIDWVAGARAYVAEPRVFLGSWFPEAGGAIGLERETDLLADSIRVLPASGSARESADGQLHYGSLQSALETETALQLAAAWDPAGRTIVSTSLAMTDRLVVLEPASAGSLLPGAARALAAALRAGETAVVPGDVSRARAWWTVARSGFVRAIAEPGFGMSAIGKVGAPGPGGGAGRRHPGQQRGGSGKGKEYTELVQEVAVKTTRAVDTFERFDATKAARIAKLLGR